MRNQKNILAGLFLTLLSLAVAQSATEQRVLQTVQQMMRSSDGRVTFSDLANNPRFSAEEKKFLGRLYEIFFQIPGFLKAARDSGGDIPSRQQIGGNFAISAMSVELLLRVMQSDPRVPPLFTREPGGEITELKLEALDAFVARRGDSVKVTGWEGKALPDFSLQSLAGETISKADLVGSESLVYFWFTGCPPCVRIAPHLSALDHKYREAGFRIIGMNADNILEIEISDERRNAYLAKNDTRYPNLHLDEETRQAFGNINVFPTLFFLDKSGTIVKHMLNYQDLATLEKVIRSMIDE